MHHRRVVSVARMWRIINAPADYPRAPEYIFPPQRETDAPGKTIILIAIDLSLLAALLHGKTNLSFISIFVRALGKF